MKKRGKILRDTSVGPGLLTVEEQQYQFFLENQWKSDIPPKAAMVVDVDFDQNGNILAISAVNESQLAKEQTEAAMAAAKDKGAALASGVVAKFGLHSLIAGGLLIVAWFFLTAVAIKSPFGSLDFTFWQVLGFLNASNPLEGLMQGGRSGPSAGIYGFLAIAAIAGPFIHHFWKDKRAILGGLLPLAFMLFVGFLINRAINSLGGSADEANNLGPMIQQMRDEAMKAISIGMGIYLSVLVSLYFAATSAKKFLVAKGGDTLTYETPRKIAA